MSISSSFLIPKEDPQDVGHQQDQAHVGREPLCVLGPADVPVLGDVGHHPAEHHGPGGDPRHQAVKHAHDLLKRLIFHVRMLSTATQPRSDVSWRSPGQCRGRCRRLPGCSLWSTVHKHPSPPSILPEDYTHGAANATPSQAQRRIGKDKQATETVNKDSTERWSRCFVSYFTIRWTEQMFPEEKNRAANASQDGDSRLAAIKGNTKVRTRDLKQKRNDHIYRSLI